MNSLPSNKLHLALAAALVATLALAGCKKADDTAVAPAPTIEPAPLPPVAPMPAATPTAVNVRTVTLGNVAGADKKIATPMTTFGSSDPIIVSIDTDGAASNATITAKLVYQDGQTAGEQSQTITTTGAETTNVTFTNANPWPAGTYRAEVWVDGTMARSTDFTVR